MLDYVLTLMGRDEGEVSTDFSIELLHTQTLALSACTTLVSVEPKLAVETRNHVMKATLGFFALPNDPSEIVDPLINNLVILLCTFLQTSCICIAKSGSLYLGERVTAYLPRCADTNSEVRKVSAQILDLLFSISLSLPRPAGSVVDDIEAPYSALSSLEDVIAILRSDASIDPSEVFSRIVSSGSVLLTREEPLCKVLLPLYVINLKCLRKVPL